MDYLSDTTFLKDLWRERQKKGGTTVFAEQHSDEIVALPWVVKGEFLRGALVVNQGVNAELFLENFLTVWPGEGTLRIYAELYGDLRRENQMIGPHDLWIAACARELDKPLLTRNAEEFKRVKKLQVVRY